MQLFLEKPWRKNTHTEYLTIYEKNIILYYMDKSFTLQCEGTICHFTKLGLLFIVFSLDSWVTIAQVDTVDGYHGWIPLSIQIIGMRWPDVDLWFFEVSNWSLILVEIEKSDETHTQDNRRGVLHHISSKLDEFPFQNI